MREQDNPAYRDTEPELEAVPDSAQGITAEQIGIAGGQGRSGEEIRGSSRVFGKILALAAIFICAGLVWYLSQIFKG